jgi:hypothetical protein
MARELDNHPGWTRPHDPGHVVDGDWLTQQLAQRDPLWNDWHHTAYPLVRAAYEVFEQMAEHRG